MAVIAGNWKMYKNQGEAVAYLHEFAPLVAGSDREVVLCVPFTALAVLSDKLATTNIALGAQNVHWEPAGAYTGEISPPMLTDLGVQYVTIGHSERRQYFGETDEQVNLRLKAAQSHGLTPILCVGETAEQRQQGLTEAHILAQLAQGLVGVKLTQLIIAYEPIWAIGSGNTCQPEEANRVIGLIRKEVAFLQQVDSQVINNVHILYGGSVKPDNIDDLMAMPEINGVLVGTASLDPQGFARIVNYR
ncbi:triosephosphate isomerase [Gloeomargarita lithophora Alchichica-D10]|uniref:Triosephosphate isomerase n=1 Tax=Gloeomargarita lithophora Alchichica-D10 TaxID=1188229 RepID=A0A1J0AEC4_9CYAN|nr:triose-phosphate isomerase [Gloeomargarita lithophora]APB34284.1 triosephosphate isomerase [Gloeomargarita lithophora Alchichica-D10]